MSSDKKNIENNRFLGSFLLSGLLHAIILFSAGIFSFSFLYNSPDTKYLEVKISQAIVAEEPVKQEQQNDQTKKETVSEPEAEKPQSADNKSEAEKNETLLTSSAVDTVSLPQVYKEPSFNVSIKYPAGWTYLDQHQKSKLEGVTFWPSAAEINPPPYIHLETVNKEYFYPSKFKNNFIYRNKDYYYNEPKETAGEWEQSVYVRTGGSGPDFVIKVLIKGKDNFNKFLPSFYAIVKSFDFNNNIL